MLQRLIKVSLLSGIVLLAGCMTVKTVPMSGHDAADFQGKQVGVSRYQAPDFTAMTAGKAAFGLIGVAAMISAGNAIVRENDVQDPAPALGQALARKMASAYGVKVAVSPDAVAKDDKMPTLLETYKSVDLLLDVKTIGWQFSYYPTGWSHYRVGYAARVRLIDVSKKKVVAQAMCNTVQGDDKNPPTKDQLLANHATLLKEYLDKAQLACGDLLSKNVLGMNSSGAHAVEP